MYSMNARNLLISTTKVLGFAAVGFGCVFAGLLATPIKPVGSAGLYREDSLGEPYLVFGHTSGSGAHFYSTPVAVVMDTAIVLSVIGISLLWLSRRFSRSLTP